VKKDSGKSQFARIVEEERKDENPTTEKSSRHQRVSGSHVSNTNMLSDRSMQSQILGSKDSYGSPCTPAEKGGKKKSSHKLKFGKSKKLKGIS
jgi:hypothetical protein